VMASRVSWIWGSLSKVETEANEQWAVFYSRGKYSQVPIGYEAEWASELVWTQSLQEKSFPSAGDPTPVVRSVVRHYTDRAAPFKVTKFSNLILRTYLKHSFPFICLDTLRVIYEKMVGKVASC
jgi:hypothetical protein